MITISLCMIVKDEEAVIGRVLSQMRGIADEIIVADTGSSDATVTIAAQFADEVLQYEWKDDFGAARNFVCGRAKMDYWMWLDADDVVTPENQARLLELKRTLDPSVDVVMMRYLTGFDEWGRVTFSYYRGRLFKNHSGFRWQGRVHEAVAAGGRICYETIAIEHRKEKAGDSERNLRIYEKMLAEGQRLEPREQFYYGRELFYHQKYEEARRVLEEFLLEKEGWVQNRLDACLHIARCEAALGKQERRLAALLRSLEYDVPGAELCCEIGGWMLEQGRLKQAVYWYERALDCKPDERSGAFVQQDYYEYLPCIQLCVCYDRLGDLKRAYAYHIRSEAVKPDAAAVRHNRAYFRGCGLPDCQ